MRSTLLRLLVCATAAAVFSTSAARGEFNLQVTEIWMGNDPGHNLTEDWFEVTNVGNTAWIGGTDGDLYFDDDSADIEDAAILSGIASIAPGESVVFVDDGTDGASAWSALWDSVVSLPQVGNYDGKGLGQSGDAVTLFLDVAGDLTVIDYEAYPEVEQNGGRSWDVVLAEFSTAGNASGAVATTAVNDENQPAVGSPGTVVPEPSCIALISLGVLAIFGRSLRKRR